MSDQDNGVQLWRVKDGSLVRTVEKGLEPISLAFSPDGRMLAVGSKDGEVRLWRVRDGRPSMTLQTGAGYFAYSLAFSLNGGILAVGSLSGTIWLWSMK